MQHRYFLTALSIACAACIERCRDACIEHCRDELLRRSVGLAITLSVEKNPTSKSIEWKQTGPRSASAVITWGGQSAEGVFYFDENGDPSEFRAKRYFYMPDGSKLEEWVEPLIITIW